MEERTYTMFSEEDDRREKVHIEKIVTKAIRYWPLFLVSIVICLCASVLYLRYVTPVYKTHAKILIKDEKKGGNSEDKLFQDLGLSTGISNVENEIEILKSRVLMQDVVRELNLHIRYYSETGLSKKEYYTDAPVTFVPLFPDSNIRKGYSYMVQSVSGKITITEGEKSYAANVGDTVRLSVGDVVVRQNAGGDIQDVHVTISPVDAMGDAYLSKVEIEPVNKQVSIINLTEKDNIPQRGRDVLNKLIAVYIRAGINDKNLVSEGTLQFIDERAQLVEKELGAIEAEIEQFKRTNNITGIAEQSKMLMEHTGEFNTKLTEQEIQLKIIESLEQYLQRQGNRIVPSTLFVKDITLTKLIEQYNSLLAQKQSLLVSSTERNPYIVNIDKGLSNLKSDIRNNVASIKEELTVSMNQIRRNIGMYDSRVQQVPEKERIYLDYARKQAVTQELYLFLLKKREETAISKSSTVTNARILEPSHSEGSPFYPSKSRIYLIAFVVGLVIPGGWVVAREVFDLKVKTREDITGLTAMPILAEIGHRKEKDVVVVYKSSKSVVSEQFRVLRTNLQFLLTERNNKAILITSSMGGEGKSFISINLSGILSLAGKRVVLLEMDLRKPKVSEHLNITYKHGFSDYAIGQAKYEDIIVPSGISDTLYVIPAGPIPPNPAELLMLPHTAELFERLRSEFDYIIIDTPPLGLVTDAQLLGKFADAALYVVRQGYTYKQQVKFANEAYKTGKLPKMNIVVNDVTMGRGSSYAYRYGYGNGYYEEDNGNGSILGRVKRKFKERK